MKFLVLSDIHGNVENIEKLKEEGVFKSCDAVLFAGDFAKFKETETGLPVLKALTEAHENIFSVIGNCDEPNFIDNIEDADISVQDSLVFFEGFAIAGSGGGTKFSGDTPNEREEDDIVSDFNVALNAYKENGLENFIAIMHNPPKDTECDKIPGDIHVGSAKLRAFIEETKPVAVITGHIHESKGYSKIGETLCVNPGALFEGNYGILTVENGKAEIELKTINS